MVGTGAWLWRWRRNALRRPSDVAEAWVGLMTVIALAVAVPAAGVVTAQVVGESLLRTARQESAERHRTQAVLVKDAGWRYSGSGGAVGEGLDGVRAVVRWTAADGSTRTGTAPVQEGLRTGTTTTIWLDTQGRPTRSPIGTSQMRARAVGCGLVGAFGASTVLLLGQRAMIWRLNRRRMAAWESEWAQVGPPWSRSDA